MKPGLKFIFKINTFALSYLLFFFLLRNSAIAQKNFTVEYMYKQSPRLYDSMFFRITAPINIFFGSVAEFEIRKMSFSKNGDTSKTLCTYSVNDTSCSSITDNFGRESFVIPGDTVRIYFDTLAKTNNRLMLNKIYYSTWMYNFSYFGKNKYVYSLYDSLVYFSGPLSIFNISIQDSSVNFNVNLFLKKITDQYNSRTAYLKKYCLVHSIPSAFQILAFSEIKSAYLFSMMEPWENGNSEFSLNDYPSEYLDALKSLKIDDENLFFKTSLYSRVAFEYFDKINNVNTHLSGASSDSLFKDKYYLIKNYETTTKIKGYLLSRWLIRNIKKELPSFDTLFYSYKNEFPGSDYNLYLDSLYSIRKKKAAISLPLALSTLIIDNNERTMTLKALIMDRPVLIDCWASWCSPCLSQMPAEEYFETKYKGKVDFIYLSFDRDKNKWLSKIKNLKLSGKNFLLDKSFKSDFAIYFDINSIPRYLIIDKNGNIFTDNAPRPTRKEALTKLLDKVLNEN